MLHLPLNLHFKVHKMLRLFTMGLIYEVEITLKNSHSTSDQPPAETTTVRIKNP